MTKPQLFHFVRPYYQHPLKVEKAKGCRVYGSDGKRYLDAYAGVASISVGHAHLRVNSRVKKQIDRVHHTSMLYQTHALQDYLQALQTELPSYLGRHFFVNSGSEAMDFACQASRAHRQKPLLLAFSEGFHGGSFLTKSVTGLEAWQPIYGQDPNVAFLPIRSCRFCPKSGWNRSSKRLTPLLRQCPADCLAPLESILKSRHEEVAGLILEPVLGVGGILVPCLGFFERIQSLVKKYKIDLIVDEVQSGFGRCGRHLFAFETLGLKPDLLCMAKGIANGFPMGLVSGTEEISAAMFGKLHFSTFGGNPVSCAAALATLEIILDEKLLLNAQNTGEHLMQQLDELLIRRPVVKEIRGLGLMIGIELDTPERARKVLELCYQKGLLIGLGGRERTVLRIEPPLSFTATMAMKTAEIIVEAIDETIA